MLMSPGKGEGTRSAQRPPHRRQLWTSGCWTASYPPSVLPAARCLIAAYCSLLPARGCCSISTTTASTATIAPLPRRLDRGRREQSPDPERVCGVIPRPSQATVRVQFSLCPKLHPSDLHRNEVSCLCGAVLCASAQ
jgi:hypothetical protein